MAFQLLSHVSMSIKILQKCIATDIASKIVLLLKNKCLLPILLSVWVYNLFYDILDQKETTSTKNITIVPILIMPNFISYRLSFTAKK